MVGDNDQVRGLASYFPAQNAGAAARAGPERFMRLSAMTPRADPALHALGALMHEKQFGQAPRLVAADAGFFSMRNEVEAHGRGVKQVAVPNLSTKKCRA